MKWPNVYEFAEPVGPTHAWFAWHPVKLWWGKWVWLKTVQRAYVVTHSNLDGPQVMQVTYEEVGR